MPEIAPARFVRFVGPSDLTSVVSPPYDVIDEAGRTELEAKSPHNYVRLILPREQPGDGAVDRYRRARGLLDEWLATDVMAREEAPSVLAVEQRFQDLSTGEWRVRRGIQALLRLREFSEGVVLPHERTLSGPKADRLELMRAVGAHLSPIFVLYPDPENEVISAVSDVFDTPPDFEAQAAGATHRAWIVRDPQRLEALQSRLAPTQGYIADGHHRYETALRFRALAREEGRQTEGTPLDYIPAFLCGMSDPGLVIFPTHRLVHSMQIDLPSLLSRAERFFDVRPVTGAIDTDEGRAQALSQLAQAGAERGVAFLALPSSGEAHVLALKPDAPLDEVPTLPSLPALRSLDVAVLHGLVFEHLLGMSRESQERQEHLRYVKDAREAVTRTRSGEAQVAFLLNPTSMQQVRDVAEAGEVMPQKSTYFYPKIVDGFGLVRLDESSI